METKAVYGEVGWESAGTFNKGDKGGKDVFLRLEDGANTIRVITKPHQYLVHSGVKAVGDAGFGQKIYCSMANDGKCPLCAQGLKSSARWMLGTIDRKSNSYKVLDVSGAILYGIKSLVNNAKWGDVSKYDVDVMKNSKAPPQQYYSVQPTPHSPLSASDQKIIDEADVEDLKRRVQPPTAEQVQKRLDKVLNGKPLFVPEQKEKTVKTAPKSVAQSVQAASEVDTGDTAEETDDVFPSYQS